MDRSSVDRFVAVRVQRFAALKYAARPATITGLIAGSVSIAAIEGRGAARADAAPVAAATAAGLVGVLVVLARYSRCRVEVVAGRLHIVNPLRGYDFDPSQITGWYVMGHGNRGILW
jgi:hypothetical protein